MIGRNYVVAWTTQVENPDYHPDIDSDGCLYIDTYHTFDNREQAERKLAELMNTGGVWSCHMLAVMDSSDYETHPLFYTPRDLYYTLRAELKNLIARIK